MAISFTPETNQEKKKFSLPFWSVWIIIPIVILGIIVYFIAFQKFPEDEITPKSETAGLTKSELTTMEDILKSIESSPFKDLKSAVPTFVLETPTVPPEKTGRSDPFAPVQ